MNIGLFDRDGHLTELGLDRLTYEPSTVNAESTLVADNHLLNCNICRGALAQLKDGDAAMVLPPRKATPAALPQPAKDALGARVLAFRRRLPVLGGIVALAAVAFFAVRLTQTTDPTPNEWRIKGDNAFTFNVYIHNGDTPVLTTHAAFPVAPGDRMGFVVTADAPGHLLILGWDDQGHTYSCFPQQDGLTAGPTSSAPIEAQASPWTVPAAMAFDDVPGREHVAAIFCPGPFTSADVSSAPCEGLPVAGQACVVKCASFDKRLDQGPRLEAP